MLGQNYTHANFSVNDMASAKSFYTDVLGFTIKKETKYDTTIESAKGTRANIYYKPDHKAWDSTVFGIEVDDVAAAVAELSTKGVQVAKLDGTDGAGIMRDPEMGEAAWFKDPAGNWICISHDA
jgi:catechol 2,3-dioxygenase-like lactoylglutathione lyase family enzyme